MTRAAIPQLASAQLPPKGVGVPGPGFSTSGAFCASGCPRGSRRDSAS